MGNYFYLHEWFLPPELGSNHCYKDNILSYQEDVLGNSKALNHNGDKYHHRLITKIASPLPKMTSIPYLVFGGPGVFGVS